MWTSMSKRFAGEVALINPTASLVQLSATRGDGLNLWYDWLGALPALTYR